MQPPGPQAGRATVLSGIGLTVLAYFLFSFHDASIKVLVTRQSVWEILFFRSVTILIGCCVVGGRRLLREAAVSPFRVPLASRALLTLTAWLCYYSGARHLQLAQLVTIYFGSPILVTLLAIPVLGERVPPSRWFGLVVGFAGVLIACQSRGAGLTGPTLLVLTAAVLWALAVVLIRKIALAATAMVQMIYANTVFLVCTGAALFATWRTPDLSSLALMLLIGVLGGLGQASFYEAMRRAPASVLAPFEYTAIIWAFILGFIIWHTVPGPPVFVGAALILTGGLSVVASVRRTGLRRAGGDAGTA